MVFTDPFAVKRSDSTTFAGSVGVTMDPSVSKRYTSPFPPLQLSATTTMELEGLAQRLVTRNIGAYESFLIDNHGKVDEDKWKFVSSKDDLKAYAEQPRVVESPHPYQQETPVADLPVVMITGTVVGDLDDVMYGVRTTNVTDVYIKGFFNPAGGIMRTIVIRSAARILLSVAKDVYCSHMKKLVWSLRQRYNGETSSSSSECTESSSSGSLDDKCCSGCGKKQSVFVQAASKTNHGAKILQKKRHCKICTRYMCLDCRRQHQLTFLLPDLRLKQRLVTVCRSCEIEAISESAMGIARDELLQGNQMQRWDSGDVFNTTMSSQSLQSE
ncbi:hypothetical protein C6341_g15888 [Phytophthora cactorum]|nr:hypothetical protein C6341_g15888 [Phytophthora cactorum]